MIDCNIVIAGAAGEGVQTVGEVLADTLSALGYAVFAWQEYESRVRGGQNSVAIRVSETPMNAPVFEADVLLPLNSGAYQKYVSRLNPNGVLLAAERYRDPTLVVPFREIASAELGLPIAANTVAIGALAGVLGIDPEALERVLERHFQSKGPELLEANRRAARLGHERAAAACRLADACPWSFPAQNQHHHLVTGTDAIAIGAVRAGCRFIAAYPMSPATGVIKSLAKHGAELGIFVDQAEDEIAACNMAIGASFAGARAMTCTSGGGFALMVEAISLAGMTETPLVIVLAQRPGPATGLPTRTAQGDLLFAVHAGHGEFPKAVLAPSDPKEALHAMVRAFDLADRFQVPVIVLSDQFLADARFSVTDFELERTVPETYLADPAAVSRYQRYALTPDGISPRLYPGQSAHLVAADSDEHDPDGHLTEDLAVMVPAMVAKRRRKGEALQRAMRAPEAYRSEDADELLLSWGSTRGAVREAVDGLRAEGRRLGMIHFSELWPLPEFDWPTGKRLWNVENNAGGQLAGLLAQRYRLSVHGSILSSDGLPLTARTIRRIYHEQN